MDQMSIWFEICFINKQVVKKSGNELKYAKLVISTTHLQTLGF